MNANVPENVIEQLLANVRQEDISAAQAIKYVDRVLSTFRRIGLSGQDDEHILKVLASVGESYEVLGSLSKAQDIYQEALNLALKLSQETEEAQLKWKLGRVFRKRNRWEQAIEYIHESQALYEKLQDTAGLARCLTSEGAIFFTRGQFAEAIDNFQQALQIGEQTDNQRLAASATSNLGTCAAIRGDFEQATTYYNNSLVLYEQLNVPNQIAQLLHNMGLCQVPRQNWAQALDMFEKSLTISQEQGHIVLTALNFVHKAQVYIALNDHTLVASYCARALDTFQEVDYPLGIAETYKVLGRLYTKKQDWATAYGLLSESLRLCQQYEKPLGIAEVQRELGRLYSAQDNTSQARSTLEIAREQFATLGARYEVRITEELLNTL